MHLPGSKNVFGIIYRIISEIPPIDPQKCTKRPNMRRMNLFETDELEYSNSILGSGAFGVVYAVRFFLNFYIQILSLYLFRVNGNPQLEMILQYQLL